MATITVHLAPGETRIALKTSLGSCAETLSMLSALLPALRLAGAVWASEGENGSRRGVGQHAARRHGWQAQGSAASEAAESVKQAR
jgi:hypothetical protein